MNRTAAFVVAAIMGLSLAGEALAVGGSMGGRMSMGTMSAQTGHLTSSGMSMQPGAGHDGSAMGAGMAATGSSPAMNGGMAGTASSATTQSTGTESVTQSEMQAMPHQPSNNN